MATDSSATGKATRRPRGAPRLLLLDAARTLFARQDYRGTTTREIADTAGVLEHLLFRQFGSKAALFREAVVVPFLRIVDDLNGRWETLDPRPEGSEAVASEFLGALYDLFVDNRGLVMTLWTADALTEEELQETGIVEIDRALGILGQLGGKAYDILEIDADYQDLAARSTVAMVAGMAAFSTTFFGGTRPPRDVIVEELAQATLHGFLHRGGGRSGQRKTFPGTVTGISSERSSPGSASTT
jgi:AcrR family transcriptional regulator